MLHSHQTCALNPEGLRVMYPSPLIPHWVLVTCIFRWTKRHSQGYSSVAIPKGQIMSNCTNVEWFNSLPICSFTLKLHKTLKLRVRVHHQHWLHIHLQFEMNQKTLNSTLLYLRFILVKPGKMNLWVAASMWKWTKWLARCCIHTQNVH